MLCFCCRMKLIYVETFLITYLLMLNISFWGKTTETEVVFKAQKRCIRSMCGLKTETYELYFKSLKFLTIGTSYVRTTAGRAIRSTYYIYNTRTTLLIKLKIWYRNLTLTCCRLYIYETALFVKINLHVTKIIWCKLICKILPFNFEPYCCIRYLKKTMLRYC